MNEEKILRALEKCDFEGELTDENCYDKIISVLKEEKDLNAFTSAQGATKLVLIFNNLNYVIKIPFTGCGSCDYYINEDEEEFDYQPFQYAGNEYSEWDYCRTEEERYKIAESAGLENFFAKTEKIGEIKGYPIYKQALATTFYDYNDEEVFTEKELTQVSKDCQNWGSCFCREWLAKVKKVFGLDILHRLTSFIEEIDINDLHTGNLGYIDDVPVIIDYSGYNE